MTRLTKLIFRSSNFWSTRSCCRPVRE